MQKLIAIWNGVRGAWEKEGERSLLCGHSELFSESWPGSGTMRNGKACELPKREPHTSALESLSLPGAESVSVPTPTANDGSFEGMKRKISETSVNRGVGLHTWANRISEGFYEVPEESLLRTVSAIEGEGGAMSEKKSREQRRMLQVRDQMAELAAQNGLKVSKAISDSLLPTPNTMDHLPARDESKIDRSKGGYSNVRETVVRMNFGRFTPAIERWEKVIERKAPDPTKPDGKEGTHRLSSKFTEWMMGLPDGWITDIGLDRKEELRACGNGVVPQQAALALRVLLERKGNK